MKGEKKRGEKEPGTMYQDQQEKVQIWEKYARKKKGDMATRDKTGEETNVKNCKNSQNIPAKVEYNPEIHAGYMEIEKKNDEDRRIKKFKSAEDIAVKVEYNPKIHALKKSSPSKKKDRYRKRDKAKKMKRKRQEKEQIYFENYNDILLDNLNKKIHTTKSPHLVFNNKWFSKIKENIVMLKSAREVQVEGKRQIYYEIDFFGDEVRYTKDGNTWILNPSNTLTNSIYIVIRLRDVAHIPKVQYHTAFGKMIPKSDLDMDRGYCYVLLSVIHVEKKVRNSQSFIEQNDLQLLKRYLRNQISTTTKNYHFKTSGIIYGFGYGPKSNRNEYGHSVCRFATSKFNNFICLYFVYFIYTNSS